MADAQSIDAGQWIGEIRFFGFNFAPQGWMICNGQQLPVSQNKALSSLLGNAFGGDGVNNFNLPNLQGSLPLHSGDAQDSGLPASPPLAPGLSPYKRGQSGGASTVTLQAAQVPFHNHNAHADSGLADSASPEGNLYKEGQKPGAPPAAIDSYNVPFESMVGLNPQTIGMTGGGKPHNNMMPTMGLNFCIAVQGIFPSRA